MNRGGSSIISIFQNKDKVQNSTKYRALTFLTKKASTQPSTPQTPRDATLVLDFLRPVNNKIFELQNKVACYIFEPQNKVGLQRSSKETLVSRLNLKQNSYIVHNVQIERNSPQFSFIRKAQNKNIHTLDSEWVTPNKFALTFPSWHVTAHLSCVRGPEKWKRVISEIN